MEWRYFDFERDQAAAARIWHEIGWLNQKDAPSREGMAAYTQSGPGYVALVHGDPGCFVFRCDGTIRHRNDDLPLAAITGVATARNGRKQGLALELTARALAEAADEGAAVAGLSTFEQGFYDRIGFGTCAYSHYWRFDPDRLTVSDKVRPPHMLRTDHVDAIHDARLQRRRPHGAVSLTSVGQTRSTILRSGDGFGLGYFDEGTETPSHCLWCTPQETTRDPYSIEFMVWKTRAQFLELMGLIKQWGDQVRLVTMTEPAGIQMQDLIDRPTQHFWSTVGGEYTSGCRAHANFQYRIVDLATCIAATHLTGPEVAFNLTLHDPMSERPRDGVGQTSGYWKGLSGDYRMLLGPESQIKVGHEAALETLEASVGAFTRLWLGVGSATALSMTDRLSGPPALMEALDEVLRLPTPQTDWFY